MPIDNRIQGGAFPDSHDAFDSSIKINPLTETASKRDIPLSEDRFGSSNSFGGSNNLSSFSDSTQTQSFPSALNTQPTLTDFTAQSAPTSSSFYNPSLEQSTLQDSWNKSGGYNGIDNSSLGSTTTSTYQAPIASGSLLDEPLSSSSTFNKSSFGSSQPDTWSTQENWSQSDSDASSFKSDFSSAPALPTGQLADIPVTDTTTTTSTLIVPRPVIVETQAQATALPAETTQQDEELLVGSTKENEKTTTPLVQKIQDLIISAKETISNSVEGAKGYIANASEARTAENQAQGIEQDQSLLNRIEQKLEQGAQIGMAAVGAMVNSFRKPDETVVEQNQVETQTQPLIPTTTPINDSTALATTTSLEQPDTVRAVVVTEVPVTTVVTEEQLPATVETQGVISRNVDVAKEKAGVAYDNAKQVITEKGQVLAEKAAVVYEQAKQVIAEKAEVLKEKAAIVYEEAKERAAVAYESAKQTAVEQYPVLKEKAAAAYESTMQVASEQGQALKEKAAMAYESARQTAVEQIPVVKEKAAAVYESARQTAAEQIPVVKEKAAAAYETTKQVAVEQGQALKEKAATTYDNTKQVVVEQIPVIKEKAAVAYDNTKQVVAEKSQDLKEKAATTYDNTKQVVAEQIPVMKEKAAVAYDNTKQVAAVKLDQSKETAQIKNEQFQQLLVDAKQNLTHVVPDSNDSNFEKARDALDSKFKAGEAHNDYLVEKMYESPNDSLGTTVGHKVEEGKQLGLEAAHNAKAEIRKKQLESSYNASVNSGVKESDL